MDDLEALIASALKREHAVEVGFQLCGDNEKAAAISTRKPCVAGQLDGDEEGFKIAWGPTFAAALRDAIEKLGDGKEGSRGA